MKANKLNAAIIWKGYSSMAVEPLELNADVFTFKVSHENENEDYLQMVDIFVNEKAAMTFHEGYVMVCVLRKDIESIIMY